MTEATEFTIGARASCSDGLCGEVSRLIVDPVARAVTHLVIEPKHRRELARLVPVGLIDSAGGDLRLRCTIAQFDGRNPAQHHQAAGGGLAVGELSSPSSTQPDGGRCGPPHQI